MERAVAQVIRGKIRVALVIIGKDGGVVSEIVIEADPKPGGLEPLVDPVDPLSVDPVFLNKYEGFLSGLFPGVPVGDLVSKLLEDSETVGVPLNHLEGARDVFSFPGFPAGLGLAYF